MPDREGLSAVIDERGPSARWREAFAALSENASPGPACPEPDRLWAAATGEAPVSERHEIIAHTASCASCAAAFRLARGLSQEKAGQIAHAAHAADTEPIRPIASRPWLRWTVPLVALAAALLVAVLVPGLWRSEPSPYRGGKTSEVRSRLPEGAVLPREQAVLLWTAGPPGSFYEVRVLTRQGREIAVETGLDAPRYQIPPPALVGLDAGMVLYWQVRTLRPDGTSVASKTFSVRLR